MKMKDFKTVDAYIKAQPADFQISLNKLRAQIKAAAPKAEEGIGYGMPAYKYKGALVYFGAFKDHCSFFPGSSSVLANRDELKGFKIAKGTIQFTPDKPIPASIIKSIVKERVLQNETKDALKKTKKPAKKKAVKKTAKKKTAKKY